VSDTAVVFDLFGTLVALDDPPEPAAAVASELDARGVAVPDDWAAAYREPHIDAPDGAEIPLPAHVSAALDSREIDAPNDVARQAVVAAFDPAVETRRGAEKAVRAAGEVGPVGLLSNCAVPELVGRTLDRAEIDRDSFDAVVASVACGWRKPDERAFAAVARQLGVAVEDLIVVGDSEATDGGITDHGGRFVDVSETSPADLPARLSEEQRCP
jgi:FMN phosphatase YigB (HAD superfamily)